MGRFQNCDKFMRTLDHVATKCLLLLNAYSIRHDVALKCTDLFLIRKYKLRDNSEIKIHKITQVSETTFVKIATDINTNTNSNFELNKLMIFIIK